MERGQRQWGGGVELVAVEWRQREEAAGEEWVGIVETEGIVGGADGWNREVRDKNTVVEQTLTVSTIMIFHG